MLTPEQLQIIDAVLKKGDSVEIRPDRDGKVKILQVKRNNLTK